MFLLHLKWYFKVLAMCRYNCLAYETDVLYGCKLYIDFCTRKGRIRIIYVKAGIWNMKGLWRYLRKEDTPYMLWERKG
jgi:hypothetical protein